jgi:hypothetical protein
MYSGEQDALCDVTLSVYPHREGLKNMPGHGVNRTYDLWNTSPITQSILFTCTLHQHNNFLIMKTLVGYK